MQREAQAAICADILASGEDRAKLSDLVTTLKEDYGQVISELDLVKAEAEALRNRNQDLIEQNMKLFLKVGNTPDPEPVTAAQAAPALTYDALFDEKGNLK